MFQFSSHRRNRMNSRVASLNAAEVCENRLMLTTYSIGELPSSYTHSTPSQINDSNPINYYRFQLSSSSDVTIAMPSVSASSYPIELSLHNSSGSQIDRLLVYSTPGLSRSFTSENLSPGDYEVRVRKNLSSTRIFDYTLQFNRSGGTTPPPPEDVDGTRDGAQRLGTLSGVDTASGSVEWNNDEVDYYQFRTFVQGDLNVQLTGITDDIDVYLEDSSGNLSNRGPILGRGENRSDTSPENFTVNDLPAGTYYIRVDKYTSGESNYNLRLELNTGTESSDDSRSGAYDLGTITGVDSATGTVDYASDEVDYYRFRTLAPGDIRIQLQGFTSDIDIYLEDSSGNLSDRGVILERGLASGNTPEDVTANDLPAGVYYVRVDKYASGQTPYNLRIEFTGEPGLPDLIADSLIVPTAPSAPGDTFDLSYRLQNLGTAASGTVPVRFFLSTDSTIELSDYVLGADGYSSVGANSIGGSEVVALQLPPASDPIWNQGAGTYYIGMIIDPNNAIQELNEGNNSNVGLGDDRVNVSLTPLLNGPRTQIIGFADGRWWMSDDSGSGTYQNIEMTGMPAVDPTLVLTGDFTGDGQDDVAAWLPNGEWYVATVANNGSVVVNHWTTWRTNDVKEIHVGDFNQDGKDDIIGLFKQRSRNRGRWWVGVSDGTQFLNRSWGDYGNYTGIANVQVGNFDGVKGDDLAIIASSGVLWMYKTSNSRFQYLNAGRWDISTGLSNVRTGDFNGDNREDLLGILGAGVSRRIQVAKSGGPAIGFYSGNWSNLTVSQSLNGVTVGDFDGDGRDNVAVLLNGTKLWYGKSNGQAFDLQFKLDWTAASGGISNLTTADTNGDGRDDILGRASTGYWHSAESNNSGFVNRQLVLWGPGTAWDHIQFGNYINNSPTAAVSFFEAPLQSASNGYQSTEESQSNIAACWDSSFNNPTVNKISVNEDTHQSLITLSAKADEYIRFAEDEIADLLAGFETK